MAFVTSPSRLVSTLWRGLACKGGNYVYEITIKLWRNEREKNWAAEINGQRYEAVAIEWIHERVHNALLDAEELLLESARRPLQ
jgi:hypothetical protein